MKKLVTLLSLSILFSCNNVTTQTPANPTGSSTPTATTVNFKDVKTLVDQKCTTCHTSVGRTPSEGISFDTTSGIGSRANQIKREVERKSMPPSAPLSETEIKLISDWVAQGGKTE